MTTFTLEIIAEFETRQPVFKLLRNGKCLIDEFWNEHKQDQNLAGQSRAIWKIIEDTANGKSLPKTRYRKLNLKHSAFEAKFNQLRIYMIHEKKTGLIIILGGKKTTQLNDLKKLIKILDEYFQMKTYNL